MGIIEFAIQEAAQEAYEKGFKLGIEKGIKKVIEEGMVEQRTIHVRNMLIKTDLSHDQIADIAECPLDFVKSVHKDIHY